MTLTRTIRRREKRQRAKERARQPRGPAFLSTHWLVKDHLDTLAEQLKMARLFNREYR